MLLRAGLKKSDCLTQWRRGHFHIKLATTVYSCELGAAENYGGGLFEQAIPLCGLERDSLAAV